MIDINFFEGLESSWERLADSGKPVYIYGMGDGCEKMMSVMKKKGIKPDGIFASDDFSRGQFFHGFEVKSLSQLEESGDDFIAVLAFGTDLADVMRRIDGIESKHELLAPDAAVAGVGYFEKEVFLDNFYRAEKAYSLLSDDQSRKVFESLTAFKITGRLEYLRRIFTDRKESVRLLDLSEDEIYCDLGAYNGDTILDFAEYTNGKYEKIYAVEPNRRNFQKCVKNTLSFNNIEYYNAAAWDRDTCIGFSAGAGRQSQAEKGGKLVRAISLDSILQGKECTYIKYDVEGADFHALRGSVRTIRSCCPKIFTALYHRPYDYIDIPIYIHSINSDYKFYMRQFSYYPAWETNLLCKT